MNKNPVSDISKPTNQPEDWPLKPLADIFKFNQTHGRILKYIKYSIYQSEIWKNFSSVLFT